VLIAWVSFFTCTHALTDERREHGSGQRLGSDNPSTTALLITLKHHDTKGQGQGHSAVGRG